MSCLIKVERGVGNRRIKYIFLIINCSITLLIYMCIYICIYIHIYIYILACGILLVFPNQGWNLCPLQWKPRVLTTGSPGKSLPLLFYPAIISFHFRVYSGLNCAVERHLLFLLGRIPPKRIKFWISGLKTSRNTRGSWYSCSRSVELLPRKNFTSSFFRDGRWKEKSRSQQRRGLLGGAQAPLLSPIALLVAARKTGHTHLSCQVSLQRGFVCGSPRQRLRKSKICYFSI